MTSPQFILCSLCFSCLSSYLTRLISLNASFTTLLALSVCLSCRSPFSSSDWIMIDTSWFLFIEASFHLSIKFNLILLAKKYSPVACYKFYLSALTVKLMALFFLFPNLPQYFCSHSFFLQLLPVSSVHLLLQQPN